MVLQDLQKGQSIEGDDWNLFIVLLITLEEASSVYTNRLILYNKLRIYTSTLPKPLCF